MVQQIMIGKLPVAIIKKAIKNLHISVLPPDGKVRVSAPQKLNDDVIRMAVIQRLAWIKKQQAMFQQQVRQSEREMVGGESHYLWGKRYLLDVIPGHGKHQLIPYGKNKLRLYVSPKTTQENRQKVILNYYREELKQQLAPLLDKWQKKLNVKTSFIGIKKMKTKWGSCNPQNKRIWINLELAKKPSECLEYIVVHELIHLLERHHNDHFIKLMDQYISNWRDIRELLKKTPIAEEQWNF